MEERRGEERRGERRGEGGEERRGERRGEGRGREETFYKQVCV